MCCCRLPSSNASWLGSGCATRSRPPSAKAFGSAARSRSVMRPWTKRSLWLQPRLRRFARSLRAIWSLVPCACWLRTSIGGEFAAKPRRLSTGRTIGGGRFGVGALAHLLKNRFYISEVVYRGEVHRGEHEPIVDYTLFEAVQAKLAAQARAWRCRLRGSPALLSGRLFDDRGNRMSPTHTNKGGARYRYYVSQAVLQRKPLAAGAIGRVPAAEIEALISAALRSHLQANGIDALGGDREVVERHVERVTLSRKHIQLQLRQIGDAAVQTDADEDASRPICEQLHGTVNVTIPWTSTLQAAAKGIIHVPAHNTPITPSRRDALLMAIAKARNWADALAHGRLGSFAMIARREGRVERHIRLLVPLAFLSPRIVSALLEGTAPADLTTTALAIQFLDLIDIALNRIVERIGSSLLLG